MFRRQSMFGFAVALGVGFILMGCSGNDDDVAAEAEEKAAERDGASLGFVGTVDDTNAFVSVVVADSDTESDEAIVYVCDGDSELREWFQGPVDDPTSFALTNDAGAAVTVELVDGTFSGRFTDATGSVRGFHTVEATGEAGIYRIDDPEAAAEDVWAGWVVDNDGNERGAFLRSGNFQATPRLSSSTFTLSRFAVTNGIIVTGCVVCVP